MAHMREEKLVTRVYGSETEYGYTLPEGESYLNQLHLVPEGIRHVGQFLENGGRLYGDVGFLEYATPECHTLEELVIHELAGEGIVWGAYGDGKSPAVTIHKRTIVPQGTETSGSHENFSTTVDIWSKTEESDKNIQALASHFATRTIFTGAGRPTGKGLALGQKIGEIEKLSGNGNTTNKALVNTRDEPHSKDSELKRLHVVCGDANISPWVIRMKYGTTSLVLRMLEHGVDLSDLFLDDPVEAAHLVSENVSNLNKPLKMRSKKYMTALDIQEELANRADKLSQRIDLPAEEKMIISEWFSIIGALKKYAATDEHQRGMEQLDWYIKKLQLKKQTDLLKHSGKTARERLAQRRALDLRYDEVPVGTGTKLRRDGKCFSAHTPAGEKIAEAWTTPPEGRARLRGAIIVELNNRGGIKEGTHTVGWEHINIENRVKSLGSVANKYTDSYIEERVKAIT
jgi:hypothetical protein